MRYIVIPEPLSAVAPNGTCKELSLHYLLETVAWVHPWWRDEQDGTTRYDLLVSLVEKFSEAVPEDVVALTDAEYEALRPILTMKGVTLEASVAPSVIQLLRPVFQAPRDMPTRGDS